MERRRIIIAAAVSAAVGLVASEASAATLSVCPSGCTFGTIQAAINAAAAGDTIAIGAGTYTENVVVDKSLTLQGSAGATVVPAVSSPNPCTAASLCSGQASSVILVQADNVAISGLTVDGNNPGISSGVTAGGVDIDARNGIITDHLTGFYVGLNVSGVTVQNVFLRGIQASSGSTFDISNNTVTNVRGDQYSIAIYNSGGLGTISGNTVSQANDGIAANFSAGTSITGNTISNAGSGVHTDNAGYSGGMADTISGNIVQNCDTNGYGVWAFIPMLAPQFTNNQVTNCSVGMAAFGQAGSATTVFTGNVVDGATSAPGSVGALASTDQFSFGVGDVNASFVANRISRFETGIVVDESKGGAAAAAASYNIIAGNTAGTGGTAAAGVDVTNNFWGCNFGPGNMGCDTVAGSFSFDPWLVNKLSVSPDPLDPGQPATLTVDLTWNSNDAQPGGGPVPDGTPIAYESSPAGTVFTPNPGATAGGTATTAFTATAGAQACARIPSDVPTANPECSTPNVNTPVPTDACTPVPYMLTPGANVLVTDTTIGRTDDFKSFCGDTSAATSAPDLVYALTLPQDGSLKIDVSAISGMLNPALYLQTTCGTDYICFDFGLTETILGHFTAGTYYLVVDGSGGTSGDFQLTISYDISKCGDGVVGPGEVCDTGAGQTGDGCGHPGTPNACQYDPVVPGTDQCPGAAVAIGGGTTILPVAGSVHTTNGYTNDYSGSCTYPPGGPERVYAVTPSASGNLTVSVGYGPDGTTDICAVDIADAGCWDRVLYARTTCTDDMTEVACGDQGSLNVETISFAVTSGTTYYVFVDGFDDQYYSQGPYNLIFTLQ